MNEVRAVIIAAGTLRHRSVNGSVLYSLRLAHDDMVPHFPPRIYRSDCLPMTRG